jgi:hypothetical protein
MEIPNGYFARFPYIGSPWYRPLNHSHPSRSERILIAGREFTPGIFGSVLRKSLASTFADEAARALTIATGVC